VIDITEQLGTICAGLVSCYFNLIVLVCGWETKSSVYFYHHHDRHIETQIRKRSRLCNPAKGRSQSPTIIVRLTDCGPTQKAMRACDPGGHLVGNNAVEQETKEVVHSVVVVADVVLNKAISGCSYVDCRMVATVPSAVVAGPSHYTHAVKHAYNPQTTCCHTPRSQV
jgi:hypothetical protein